VTAAGSRLLAATAGGTTYRCCGDAGGGSMPSRRFCGGYRGPGTICARLLRAAPDMSRALARLSVGRGGRAISPDCATASSRDQALARLAQIDDLPQDILGRDGSARRPSADSLPRVQRALQTICRV